MAPKNKPDAPTSPPEDGASFGELMNRFNAEAVPMRVMLAPEHGAAWRHHDPFGPEEP